MDGLSSARRWNDPDPRRIVRVLPKEEGRFKGRIINRTDLGKRNQTGESYNYEEHKLQEINSLYNSICCYLVY